MPKLVNKYFFLNGLMVMVICSVAIRPCFYAQTYYWVYEATGLVKNKKIDTETESQFLNNFIIKLTVRDHFYRKDTLIFIYDSLLHAEMIQDDKVIFPIDFFIKNNTVSVTHGFQIYDLKNHILYSFGKDECFKKVISNLHDKLNFKLIKNELIYIDHPELRIQIKKNQNSAYHLPVFSDYFPNYLMLGSKDKNSNRKLVYTGKPPFYLSDGMIQKYLDRISTCHKTISLTVEQFLLGNE